MIATVSGWGRLVEGGAIPDQLQSVNVPIIANATAVAQYNNLPPPNDDLDVTGNMIAAGAVNVGGIDACTGDSGGPMIVRDGPLPVLAGIVSYGIGCARPNFLGIYTRVSNYCDWISDRISAIEDGGDVACSANTVFNLRHHPFGANVTWTATPASYFVTSSGTGATANLRSAINSQATATLTFTITSGCGTTTVSRTINVGSPVRPNLSINGLTNPSARVQMNQSALATITSSSAISSWSVSAGLTIISQNSNSITFRADTPGFASVNGFRTNSCGTSGRTIGIHVLEPGAGPSPFVVTPNPADDFLSIEYDGSIMLVDSQLSSADGLQINSTSEHAYHAFSVRLFNSRQEVVLEAESKGENLQLDVSRLQPGIYILHIYEQEAVLQRKIIVI